MKKSKRPKASKGEDGVDLISNMPDAILVLILSRLRSTKEAIRSSILSRRWRNLWTAVPSLDMHYGRKSRKSEFKEFVYWVLASKTVDLDSFRLSCSNLYSMSTVGRWIHMAVTRNVKQLNLTFRPKEKTEAVELPHCLVTCSSLELLSLNLDYRGLSLPKFTGFRALRVLKLAYVDFLLQDYDLVNDFLATCPLLEALSLEDCVLRKLDLLCISCPKLKRLNIHCETEGCCDIKISCPKLVDLDIHSDISCNLFFERLDSLTQAVIEFTFEGNTVPVLFHGNSHVKPLWMNLYFLCECIDGACDLALPNLKTLVLQTTMDAFTMDNFNRILKFCPKLESLKLTFIIEDLNEKYECLDEDEIRRIMSPDVKRVEFFEFNGEKPKLVIELVEDTLFLFFTWGNEAGFSNC